jgi:hypothetical protein
VVGRVRRLVQNEGAHSLTRTIAEIKSAVRKGREERSLAALAEKAAPGIADRTIRQGHFCQAGMELRGGIQTGQDNWS